MWLLHTKTLELRFFTDSGSVRYAALSHVWEADDHRQPFREIQAIYSRCLASGEDPRELVTAKVRNFLALAESEGYEWGWLDTACIDKTSSASLSEAINCMYLWYSDADVCYVYLSDVSDDDDPFLPESDFTSSRWHTRGWTLQELIAPLNVVFLSMSWKFVGTRASLADVLQKATGIDLAILLRPGTDAIHYHNDDQLWSESNVSNVSVARRMSWASRRRTTRPEDRAYSLTGIFGVSMSIIYGEGAERSFERLQMEIISLYPADQTIFAWGRIHPDIDVALENLGCPDSFWGCREEEEEIASSKLLASSPGDFAPSSNFQAIDAGTYEKLFGKTIDTNYAITRSGAVLHLPLTLDWTCTSSPHHGVAMHAAALACAADESKTSIVLLFLTRPQHSEETDYTPSRPAEFKCIGAYWDFNWSACLKPGSMKHPKRRLGQTSPRFYRGVVLQLPGSLNDLCFPFRSHTPFQAEVSYLTLREIKISIPPILPTPPYSLGYFDWEQRSLGFHKALQLQIPAFTLRRLEKHGFRIQYISGSPMDESHNGLIFTTDHIPHSVTPNSWLGITFANPGHGERLTMSFGTGCRCLKAQSCGGLIFSNLYFPWIEFTMSNVVHDSVVSTTKLLAHGQVPKYDQKCYPDVLTHWRNNAGCPAMHLFPPQKGYPPFVFRLDDTRAIHVRCRQFGLTDHPRRAPPGDPPKRPVQRRFVVAIDLVGFEPASQGVPNVLPDVSLVNGKTTPIQGPHSELTLPPPDTTIPRSTGHGIAPVRARRVLPALTSGLARCVYTANHSLDAGLRAAAEWLGKEADYTCGQLVWDEWSVGGV